MYYKICFSILLIYFYNIIILVFKILVKDSFFDYFSKLAFLFVTYNYFSECYYNTIVNYLFYAHKIQPCSIYKYTADCFCLHSYKPIQNNAKILQSNKFFKIK